jgi:acetyl-CoA carboxylase biotin carboxyl carrier protein
VPTAAAPTAADERRHPVRSTAVGFVKLSPDIHVGGKVTKGSLVATVDVLGVAVEVRADHGGIVAKLRCASGDPVEYGQELFLLESVGEGKL